jgi:hypothetical protein
MFCIFDWNCAREFLLDPWFWYGVLVLRLGEEPAIAVIGGLLLIVVVIFLQLLRKVVRCIQQKI